MFPLNNFYQLCIFFLLLMIYSVIGWMGEMIYCSVPKGHLCEKRGFLNGFLCPIYGHGALLVLYVLQGGFQNPLLTFLAGMVLTSALEYFTSWLMEKLFHMRWWDYSHKKIQLHGRICLLNSVLFGLACVLLCHVMNPLIMAWLFALSADITVPAAAFLLGVYLTDTALSIRSAIQLSHRLQDLQKLQQEVRAHLEEKKAAVAEKLAETRENLSEKLDQMSEEFLAGSGAQYWRDSYDAFYEEKQRRLMLLQSGQDAFERRLLRSHPSLSSRDRGAGLQALRERFDIPRDKKH